ncbi:unnamed protein product [Prorocentrum cordatum]|uniref:DNA-directed primase/polymerase protein n=2 Tax=Prorocentrum cordatum TaxID=2364126 RepID=A0ABN9Q619_9DINO|nr:unnamed protein product [Polarella glacialis]
MPARVGPCVGRRAVAHGLALLCVAAMALLHCSPAQSTPGMPRQAPWSGPPPYEPQRYRSALPHYEPRRYEPHHYAPAQPRQQLVQARYGDRSYGSVPAAQTPLRPQRDEHQRYSSAPPHYEPQRYEPRHYAPAQPRFEPRRYDSTAELRGPPPGQQPVQARYGDVSYGSVPAAQTPLRPQRDEHQLGVHRDYGARRDDGRSSPRAWPLQAQPSYQTSVYERGYPAAHGAHVQPPHAARRYDEPAAANPVAQQARARPTYSTGGYDQPARHRGPRPPYGEARNYVPEPAERMEDRPLAFEGPLAALPGEAGLRQDQAVAPRGGTRLHWRLSEAVVDRQHRLDSGEWDPAQIGLFAKEVGEGGQRQFFVDTFAKFSMDVAAQPRGSHLYEVILEDQPCWLYFDLEFYKDANPQLNSDAVMAQFREALASFCAKEGFAYDESRMVFLESSTDKKFSMHVIGKWIAFRNNFQAGQFVEMFLEYARGSQELGDGSGTNLLFVRGDLDDIEATVSVVDASVYSRNRCFRVLRQSKFGKIATLELQDGGGVVSESDLPHFQVLRTLASFVPDGTPFCEHFKIPADARHAPQAGVVVDADSNMQMLLNWLMVKWDSMRSEAEGNIYSRYLPTQVSKLIELDDGKYMAQLSNNRFCLQRERSHKSNGVFFIIDLTKGIFYQKCFDHEDCAGFSKFQIPGEFLLASHGLQRQGPGMGQL